nr:hypothetical protein B0A51_07871 [Rachicladosporium sp. CCFEE 5018]
MTTPEQYPGMAGDTPDLGDSGLSVPADPHRSNGGAIDGGARAIPLHSWGHLDREESGGSLPTLLYFAAGMTSPSRLTTLSSKAAPEQHERMAGDTPDPEDTYVGRSAHRRCVQEGEGTGRAVLKA